MATNSVQKTLINDADINEMTTVGYLVEAEYYRPYIKLAELQYVVPSLGKELYDDLFADIMTNTAGTRTNEELFTYLLPAIAHYSIYEAIPFIQYRIQTKGIVSPEGDGDQTAALEQVKYLRSSYKQTADTLKREALAFIQRNPTMYPSYPGFPPADSCRRPTTVGDDVVGGEGYYSPFAIF